MKNGKDIHIEIREGFFAGDHTNIVPVRKDDSGRSYEEKTDDRISICCYYLEGYLESLLNKYYSKDVQIINNNSQEGYDEFGWNFYTPEQIERILGELDEYTKAQKDRDNLTDFYIRFINRMNRMLQNMDGFDLILFCGP